MASQLRTANMLIGDLYEALEGFAPSKCSCSPEQLQDACACGHAVAKAALDKARPYYLANQ